MTIQQWMSETRASDIMSRKIVTFDPQDTLAEVAEKLLAKQISGAPVVSGGRCVGVFSVYDMLQAENEVTTNRTEFAQSSFWDSGLSLPVQVYEDKLAAVRAKIAPIAEHFVERHMTRDVVTVDGTDPVAVVIQKMVDGHIHRVVVVDEESHVVGLISTIDVLAALMKGSRTAGAGK